MGKPTGVDVTNLVAIIKKMFPELLQETKAEYGAIRNMGTDTHHIFRKSNPTETLMQSHPSNTEEEMLRLYLKDIL